MELLEDRVGVMVPPPLGGHGFLRVGKEFSPNLKRILKIKDPLECVISRRLNKFVVEVTVKGESYRAYLNNTGRLTQFLARGKVGFCLRKKTGKTDLRLFSVKDRELGAIVDTKLQTEAFEKSLKDGFIPWLDGYKLIRRNVKLGDSVIDYLLERDRERIYLEVKSAVLRDGKHAMYPDCPSMRGRRQIRELIRHTGGGGLGILLFIAALPEVEAFKPNREVDPEVYKLILEAERRGVEVKSISIHYDPRDRSVILSNPDLRVLFDHYS